MTHVKFTQVLQGPEQDERCAPRAGEHTEQCAQHAGELHAREATRSHWCRPLTAATNGHRRAGGAGSTLESVKLVRSALAQPHRSAICQGDLSAYRSTGTGGGYTIPRLPRLEYGSPHAYRVVRGLGTNIYIYRIRPTAFYTVPPTLRVAQGP